jgi:chaperonin GroES
VFGLISLKTKEEKMTATLTQLKLKPLDDKVVIVIESEDTEKTSGGIFIPDSAREKPQRGKVVSAGPGRVLENGTRLPMTVQVGQTVLFQKYGGSELKYEGQEYKILSEKDILGIIE